MPLREAVEPEQAQPTRAADEDGGRGGEANCDLRCLDVVADPGTEVLVDGLEIVGGRGGEELTAGRGCDLLQGVLVGGDVDGTLSTLAISDDGHAILRAESDGEDRDAEFLRLLRGVDGVRLAQGVRAVGEQDHDHRRILRLSAVKATL